MYDSIRRNKLLNFRIAIRKNIILCSIRMKIIKIILSRRSKVLRVQRKKFSSRGYWMKQWRSWTIIIMLPVLHKNRMILQIKFTLKIWWIESRNKEKEVSLALLIELNLIRKKHWGRSSRPIYLNFIWTLFQDFAKINFHWTPFLVKSKEFGWVVPFQKQPMPRLKRRSYLSEKREIQKTKKVFLT